jgi:hypothetical protein
MTSITNQRSVDSVHTNNKEREKKDERSKEKYCGKYDTYDNEFMIVTLSDLMRSDDNPETFRMSAMDGVHPLLVCPSQLPKSQGTNII